MDFFLKFFLGQAHAIALAFEALFGARLWAWRSRSGFEVLFASPVGQQGRSARKILRDNVGIFCFSRSTLPPRVGNRGGALAKFLAEKDAGPVDFGKS